MIEKIARDVSDKLNATPSRDFDGMVGLEAHLREMRSLLDLDNDEVKMVAVSGPAGIGKSTLARALQIQLADRLETIIDHQDIEEVLRIGYESLHENEKSLFLHIAVFSNFKDGHLVEAMFADNNLDTKYGLKILANKSLIHVFNNGDIVMHKLLRQMGRQAIQRQEPWKRQILIDPQEICDVLERANEDEIMFEFISTYPELDIVECGVHVLTEESEIRRRKEFDQANKASQVSSLNTEITDGLIRNSKEDNNGEAENRTDCWNCLFLCFGLSDFVRSTASLFWGRRQI
ncbi:hypothetical protein DY000_02012324 [Brassica cretica]|uniref:Disease resistance protein Roq1-like winged-helix domain-containing protein n=1 Tax=Brassica cretica TaxID=69181 RepID=A0ABQ7D724_BRACR|nr:hypothetical protein DY000_02012324 [Brassica cretica]